MSAINTPRQVPYPDGMTGALCLTFDMDAETMWTSTDSQTRFRPAILSHGAYDVGLGLDLVLEFLARNDIQTTFFVPSATAQAHPERIMKIMEAGHEIANHGTDHCSTDGLSEEDERRLFEESQNILTNLCGYSPAGYRAPLFEVNPGTFDILSEMGFAYSSNMATSIYPYRHEGLTRPVVEIPTHHMLDDGSYFYYSDYPPIYTSLPPPRLVSETWTEEVKSIIQLGGVATLVLHPQLIGRPSRLRILQDVVDTARTMETVWLPKMGELAATIAEIR